MTDIHFAPRELAIMGVLWRLGSGTVTEVREALDADLTGSSPGQLL
jgi:predicted transcriptional regulator